MRKNTIFLLVIIAAFFCQAEAAEFYDDISESMYFKKSAYPEAEADKLDNFKASADEGQRGAINEQRQEELKNKWIERVEQENADFKAAKDLIRGIKKGVTCEQEILELLGKNVELLDQSEPWRIIPRWMQYPIEMGSYPEPHKNEKIIAHRFYFTEGYLPRMGMSLDLLITVNKETGVIENFSYYYNKGYIFDYWMSDVIPPA